MKCLIVWSCGPIQDFIASARKGRDLWFGSWILSNLARAAALRVAGEYDIDALIMPAPRNIRELGRDDFNVSNKLLVRVDGDPQQVAAGMSEAARTTLRDLASEAFDSVKGKFHRRVAELQVDDMLETYWAAASEEECGGYAQARAMAEALHAARKSDRPFSQPAWSLDGVPKSSLDGARESVIPESVYDTPSPDKLRELYGIGPAERLCGVGLFKRFGHKAAKSPRGARIQSTSHFAAMPTIQRLVPNLHKAAFDSYVETLKRLGAKLGRMPGPALDVVGKLDAHILYASRLGEFVPDSRLDDAQQALRKLFSTWARSSLEAWEDPPPPVAPYYALLVADGDSLGKALEQRRTPSSHMELSRLLEDFARSVETLLQKHHGQLVYSGGDDVMALLPVSECLHCAQELSSDFQDKTGLTMSAGICIGHHLEPLRDVLEAARSAEQIAKQDFGRNAWAVILKKRSGAPMTVGGKWNELEDVLLLLELFRNADIPRGLPYDLMAAHRRLSGQKSGDLSDEDQKRLPELRRLEGIRILIRKGLRPVSGEIHPQDPSFILEPMFQGGDLEGLANKLILARTITGWEGSAT